MSAAPTLPPNTAQLRTLSNGLEVILLEDHAHPVASVQVWIKAGSLHEEHWTGAGLAHLVEHMLFKGTEKRNAQQISRDIQSHGGYVNAYTTFNRTVYWIEGTADKVDDYLEILGDMVRNSLFAAEELTREQEVIRREFAMDNDDPHSVVQHLLQATAFRQHPLRHPIIGHLDVFNQVKRDDVVGFVRRHYVPNNCFVVVVGDVDAEATLQSLEKSFGSWERRPYEPIMMPEEPAQTGLRRAEKEFNTDIVRLSMGWHIGGESHPDKPVLDVLGFILGSGRSSRLNLELRDRLGVAHWAGSGAWAALDRGMFALEAECDAGDLTAAEEAIARTVAEVKGGGCKKDELEKAVRATLGHQLRLRSTTRGMAASLGHSWLAVGNLDYDRTYLERISAMTVDEVTASAQKYLVDATCSRVSLHPQGTLQKLGSKVSAAKREEAVRFELSNGLVLLVGENRRLPLVSMRAQFLAGVPRETDLNAGVTQIAAQMLAKGTARYTDEQIAALLEDRGGSLQSSGDAHRLVVGADVMKGDEGLAMELMSELLLTPTFPEKHLGNIQKRQLAAIREEQEDPLTVALRRGRKEIFQGLPFARTALGTLETVEAMRVDTCRDLWRQGVQGRNGVISVFGDVDPEEIRERVEHLLGPIEAGEKSTAGFTPMQLQSSGGRFDLELDKEQGVLVIGFPTVGLANATAPVLSIIDEACSDMGSRLFNRIREELGLAYYVGAQSFHALGAGAFYFYVGTDPAKLEQTETELRKEIADLAAHGLTQEELTRSKATWKSSWLRHQQGNSALADGIGWDELNGLGFHHHRELPGIIEGVSQEQTQVAAAQYFDLARAFTVTVRPPGKK